MTLVEQALFVLFHLLLYSFTYLIFSGIFLINLCFQVSVYALVVNGIAYGFFFFFSFLGLEYYLFFPSWTGHTITFQGTSAKVKYSAVGVF